MWEMRIENSLVKSTGSEQVDFTISVTMIRDGTPGVSISMDNEITGQWTDSKAGSLWLTPDYRVEVCDTRGRPRYRLVLPGTPVRGERLSASELIVTVQL